eukprot:6198854-Pleurochrysis_carterae.AAC.2
MGWSLHSHSRGERGADAVRAVRERVTAALRVEELLSGRQDARIAMKLWDERCGRAASRMRAQRGGNSRHSGTLDVELCAKRAEAVPVPPRHCICGGVAFPAEMGNLGERGYLSVCRVLEKQLKRRVQDVAAWLAAREHVGCS